jgi:hypothetical protein
MEDLKRHLWQGRIIHSKISQLRTFLSRRERKVILDAQTSIPTSVCCAGPSIHGIHRHRHTVKGEEERTPGPRVVQGLGGTDLGQVVRELYHIGHEVGPVLVEPAARQALAEQMPCADATIVLIIVLKNKYAKSDWQCVRLQRIRIPRVNLLAAQHQTCNEVRNVACSNEAHLLLRWPGGSKSRLQAPQQWPRLARCPQAAQSSGSGIWRHSRGRISVVFNRRQKSLAV